MAKFTHNEICFDSEEHFIRYMCDVKHMIAPNVSIQVPPDNVFITYAAINTKPILAAIMALSIITGKGKTKSPFCDYDPLLKKELNKNKYFSYSYGALVEHQMYDFEEAFKQQGWASFIYADCYNMFKPKSKPRCIAHTMCKIDDTLHSTLSMVQGSLHNNFAIDVAQHGYLHKYMARRLKLEEGPLQFNYALFEYDVPVDEDRVIETGHVDSRLLLNDYVVLIVEANEILRVEEICREVMPKLVPDIPYPIAAKVNNFIEAVHEFWTRDVYA